MKNGISLMLIAFSVGVLSCTKSDDPNAQLNKELAAIDAQVVNGTNFVIADSLGDRIILDVIGSGAPPSGSQTVTVSYSANLFTDGTLIGSGLIHQKVNDISLPGLQAGLKALMNGSRARIYIPSKYAFGSQGTSIVPPNASVVYTVSLEDVERTATEQTQFEADTLAIHNYLKANSNTIKNPILHASGIWYTIDNLGTGVPPRPYDRVSFTYEGINLADSKTFDQGTITQYNIFNLINGLRVGIPLMQKGNTATFYIPSGLAYGPAGAGSTIKANANLIFTVTLTSIF